MKPKNLGKVKPLREKNTTEINKVENTPLDKRNKEHYGNLEIAKVRMTSAKNKKELQTLWLI